MLRQCSEDELHRVLSVLMIGGDAAAGAIGHRAVTADELLEAEASFERKEEA